jgi:fructose-bisphosphate aldolase class II
LTPYKVSGAQHGTSGNSSEHLREIAEKTRTTKANVATALQMISWGVKVNDYGNAIQDEQGNFIKMPGQGMSDELWQEITTYASEKGLKGGDYKKLNLPFENKLLGQPKEIRERMINAVADFTSWLITDVFNAKETAPLVHEEILKANAPDPGPKAERIEDPADWTREKIIQRAKTLDGDKGPSGDFDD